MKNNYLFEDIDDISFKLKLKEMMKEASFKDCSVSTYQMDENDFTFSTPAHTGVHSLHS